MFSKLAKSRWWGVGTCRCSQGHVAGPGVCSLGAPSRPPVSHSRLEMTTQRQSGQRLNTPTTEASCQPCTAWRRWPLWTHLNTSKFSPKITHPTKKWNQENLIIFLCCYSPGSTLPAKTAVRNLDFLILFNYQNKSDLPLLMQFPSSRKRIITLERWKVHQSFGGLREGVREIVCLQININQKKKNLNMNERR